MLTDPNLGDDARAALAGLNPDTRTGLSQGLGTIVNKTLEKTIHPWFSKGMHDWADVDVYAAGMRDGMRLVRFESGKIGDASVEVVFRVADEAGERLIRYLPEGKGEHEVQRVELIADGPEQEARCAKRLGGGK